MSDHESTVQRIRHANPVASLTALREEELEAVRALLDRRRGRMVASRTPTKTRPRWRRPVLVAGIAFVVTLAALGSALLFLRGGENDVVATTTTMAPTTTLAATPGLVMTWSQAPTQEAFGLNDAISTVIEGGPGLIAAGCVLDSRRGETVNGPTDAAVWVSADGLTWERVGDAEVFGGAPSVGWDGNQVITDLVRGPNGYVAVGWVETDTGDQDPPIWFSRDGIEWERVTGRVEASLGSVIADANGYLAVGGGVWRSPDGRTWTRIDEEGFDQTWQGGMFSYSAASVVALPDGYAFVADANSEGESALPFGDPLFVSSPDGIAWTAVPITQERGWVFSLRILNGLLVASGWDSDGLASWVSSDGAAWERLGTIPGRERNAFASPPVADGDFWLVGSMEANYPLSVARVFVSADHGLTWQEVAAFDSSPEGSYTGTVDQRPAGIRELIHFNDGLIAVGGTGNGSAPVWIGTWDQP